MSTPGFLELQLDPLISQGSTGGLSFSTLVVANPTHSEIRFQQQGKGFWKLSINLNDKSKAQMLAIRQHFNAVNGKTLGWRFRNWQDYQATNDTVVPIDSTHGQLSRTWAVGGVTTVQTIKKPDMSVAPTLQRNGVAFPSSGNWSLDTTTGIVTYNASQAGQTITWTGLYDMPARFDTDDMSSTWDDFNIFSWSSIPIIEIQV